MTTATKGNFPLNTVPILTLKVLSSRSVQKQYISKNQLSKFHLNLVILFLLLLYMVKFFMQHLSMLHDGSYNNIAARTSTGVPFSIPSMSQHIATGRRIMEIICSFSINEA